MAEPTPEPVPVGDHQVVVPRRALAGIAWLLLLMVLLGTGAIGGGAWFVSWQQGVNDRQTATDHRLSDFIHRVEHDNDLARAKDCVGAHIRFEIFKQLAKQLTQSGATLGAGVALELEGASPERITEAQQLAQQRADAATAPLIRSYPQPSCDLRAAVAKVKAG